MCVYECMRLVFLTGVFMVLQPEGETPFPWLTLVTPGALFFLMALFWLLDISRYRLFCPLYLAGKGFSVITAILWLLYSGSAMIRGLIYSPLTLIITVGIAFFLYLGDMLSAWAAMKLMRNQ